MPQYNAARPGKFGASGIMRRVRMRRRGGSDLPWLLRRGIQQRGFDPGMTQTTLDFFDAYTLAETVSNMINWAFTDTFTGADAVPSRQAAVTKADSFASSDGTTTSETELLTINDTFTISDAATIRGVKIGGAVGADAFAISEALNLAIVTKSFTDAFAVTDSLTNKFVSKATGDVFALGDAQSQHSSDILNFTDNFLLSDALLLTGVKSVGIASAIAVGARTADITSEDAFVISDSLDTLNLRTQLIFDDAFTLDDTGGFSSSVNTAYADSYNVSEFADGLPAPVTPVQPLQYDGAGAVSKKQIVKSKPKRTKKALTFADSFMLMDSCVVLSRFGLNTSTPVVGLEKPAREIYNSAVIPTVNIDYEDLIELLMTGVI